MLDFFEEIDAVGLAEDHALAVVSLEEEQAQKILKSYRRVASKLRIQLSQLPTDTFTAQRIRVVLMQLESAILTLQGDLTRDTISAAELMANQSISNLVTEVQSFAEYFKGTQQPINLSLVKEAVGVDNYLVNQFQVSVDTYSASLRSKLSEGISDMVIARESSETFIDKLSNFFVGEEWRLRRIVRTELHGIYGRAKIDSMGVVRDEYMPELKKTLYHPMDSRTGADSVYAASKNLIVDIDQPFKYKWKGKDREFMAPPDRPNDRSILIPYDPSWK